MKKNITYRPISEWTGRLILPAEKERRGDGGVFIEVQNAPASHKKLIGKKGWLTLKTDGAAQEWINQETRDIVFTDETYKSIEANNLHPDRLNGRKQVSPLETIAGGRPTGDVHVLLKNAEVITTHEPRLNTTIEPTQICGSHKALVQFAGDYNNKKNQIKVVHYNPASGQFDGAKETINVTSLWYRTDLKKTMACLDKIHKSPLNQQGWYIFGEFKKENEFTLYALEPRELLRVKIDSYVAGKDAVDPYIEDGNWEDCKKGNYRTTLLDAGAAPGKIAMNDVQDSRITPIFKEGVKCFLLHLFGWVMDPDAWVIQKAGLVQGHFSFGVGTVVRDPFTDELRWDVEYKQVYAHTQEGIISGSQKWHVYMGNLKTGWMYLTPISDVLIYHPGFSHDYDFDGQTFKPFEYIEDHLHRVMARIRSGNGTGLTFVNMATSCVQDAALGLYAALMEFEKDVFADSRINSWIAKNPDSDQARRFKSLRTLVEAWNLYLRPYKVLPVRWLLHEKKIDLKIPLPHLTQFADAFLTNKTLLPRIAHDGMARVMADHDALLWFIRTDQIGGRFKEYGPLWPTTFEKRHPPEIELSGLPWQQDA